MNASPRLIHLLYVPTLNCNLGCRYCYLGEQTTTASLKSDAARAVNTLQTALQRLDEANVLAFNVSLHGGEATTMPPAVLDGLFTTIRAHYLKHFDVLHANGHRKSAPHIKTNLYNFHQLYDLFDRHKVSVSASIDLPLALHGQYRVTRGGADWLARTHANLRLLAKYPHAKKISATLSREHLARPDELVADIWYIHRELGFDMNQLNLMFAFPSQLNRAHQGEQILTPASEAEQVALFELLQREFTGTELEEGLRRHWFDEFTPSYCTNAVNCGEKFYLLQGDGEVYSCVRGQGLPEFRYGNLLSDPVHEVLAAGAAKIRAIHEEQGFAADCRGCGHLSRCNTGCAVVKFHNRSGKSYTCALQQTMYSAAPVLYPLETPADQQDYARWYQQVNHPASAIAAPLPAAPVNEVLLPRDLHDDKNALSQLITADDGLRALFSPQMFALQIDDDIVPLASQLLKSASTCYTLAAGDTLRLHINEAVWDAACDEPVRNTLYLQLLRDTPVVYGDEQRTKQEHLFSYQLFRRLVTAPSALGAGWRTVDLAPLLALHASLFVRGVLNNCFVTTGYLRDYHYQKQKNNAFYHIQALNLPFPNFEFYYLPEADDGNRDA